MRAGIDGMLLSRCCSGVEVSIRNLARSLARWGQEEYVLYVPAGFPEHDVTGPRFRTKRIAVAAHVRTLRILWEQIALPSRLAGDACDLAHAPGYLAPLRARVPVVITVYDLIALQYPRWCKPLNRMNYRVFLPLSVRKADGIIVPSRATAEAVRSVFPHAAEKVKIIPLGVDPAFRVIPDPSLREETRRRLGLPFRFILFVGRHEPKKNLTALIDAFHLIRSHGGCACKLVLAGTEGWRQEPVRRRIRQLGLEAEIVFPGYVSQETLPLLYNLADVFVFPSLYEGFGLPPIEAMACGVPVVCSDGGALPEVTGDAALRVDPSDTPRLAAAIQSVMQDSELRRQLIEKGLRRAQALQWEAAVRATEAFYREVAEVKPKRTAR